MRYFIYCRKSSEAEDRQIASIDSQLATVRRTFGDRPDVEIVGMYEEAFSAKAPGRERFGEMLSQIERGEADGIIAWAPDRLARNSVDGGQIIYLLDRGVLRDLKFVTYTFENNSQGKFMLQIMFGQSKYYSDALSENVKRGNRTKVEKGWRPGQVPLGYLNDPATKTIVKDPLHFPLIRNMFELMLTGAYTPKQIATIARDDWGFLTPQRKKIGGTPLSLSSIYHTLNNSFYAGLINWEGQTYLGKHERVVSLDEFERVCELLGRPSRPRPKRHLFAFTGMIRCGSCGLAVTAEHKHKPSGRHYIYYHCSKRRLGPRCTEPSVELRALQQQIERFLRSLTIDRSLERWVLEEVALSSTKSRQHHSSQRQSLEASIKSVEKQLDELTGLRIRSLLTDQEYLLRRGELQKECIRLRERADADKNDDNRFEPVAELVSFSNRAADWFSSGDDRSKRLVLETVGSNPTLKGGILSIVAKKPFLPTATVAGFQRKLGVGDDDRITRGVFAEMAETIARDLQDADGQQILHNIRVLRERFEPEVVAKEKALRSHQAKAVRGAYRAREADGSWQSPLHS